MDVGSPLVSVLIAVRDGADYLPLSLRSVLRQTIADLELVVVDDASTDATPDVLASTVDPRLVVLRNNERLGLAGSLNRGLDLATGRYVARMDADDVAFPHWLERQLRELRARPRLAVVGAGVLEVDAHGRSGALHILPRGLELRWHALFSSPFLHNTVVLDRQVLESRGLRYDPEFAETEDYELWTRLLAIATGDNVPEPLVLYRHHPEQATARRRGLQRALQRHIALREIGHHLPGVAEEERDLVWRLVVGEPLEPSEVEHGADVLLALVDAFERVHPGPAARRAAARALVRAFAYASARGRPRVLRRALGLDPLLAAHGVASRARSRRLLRAAAPDARAWLDELRSRPESAVLPTRVVAVFPEPTPYRAPLLDRVAALPDVDLTVVYAAETVARRTWEVAPEHRAVFLRGIRVPGAARVLRHDYPLTPGLARVLRRARPSVVVVSGWSTFAAQAAIAWCRLDGVPYVLVVESHDEDPRPGWRRAVKGAIVPRVVREASGVLVTGSLARDSMIARGASPDRIGIFANTIDVESFGERADRLAESSRPQLREALGAGPDDVVVLSVGRLAREKAHDTLLRAVAATHDSRFLVLLAGEGPERDLLARLGDELGLRLVLSGDLPWERIVEAYVTADVFALLSEREPWGVVVNEAAACGLPLVLSDRVGAAADLLRDGENGFLVPVGHVSAAERALRRLASDSLARLALGAESRRIAASWGYGPSIEAFREAVRRAASEPARPAR